MSILGSLFGLGVLSTATAKQAKLDKEMNDLFEQADRGLQEGRKIRRERENAKIKIISQLNDPISVEILNRIDDFFCGTIVTSSNWNKYKNNTIPQLLDAVEDTKDKELILNYYNKHLLKYERFARNT